jgi:hypothetical protein
MIIPIPIPIPIPKLQNRSVTLGKGLLASRTTRVIRSSWQKFMVSS